MDLFSDCSFQQVATDCITIIIKWKKHQYLKNISNQLRHLKILGGWLNKYQNLFLLVIIHVCALILVRYIFKAHSCVEKAGMLGFVKMRQLDVDVNYSLRGHVLERAIEAVTCYKYLAKVKNNIEKIIRFEFWKAKNKTFHLFQEDRKLGLIPFFVSMDKPKNKNKIGSTYGCINPLILVFFYNKLSQQLNFLNCTINNYTFHHFPKIF